MNTTASEELVEAVSELRTLFPDWRFGQLVANLVLAAGRDGALWDVEDEELLTAARQLIEQNRARRAEQTAMSGLGTDGMRELAKSRPTGSNKCS